MLRLRRHKYNAKPTVVEGIRFHSKKEAERYKSLRLLQAAGQIINLETQRRFQLEVNGEVITTYVADFVYREKGILVVEDTKGFPTPEYRIKKKLMEALYGIRIKET